jgi:hypothetical protein
MGILPLQFLEGQQAKTLGLTGREKFTINIHGDIKPGQIIEVQVLFFFLIVVIIGVPLLVSSNNFRFWYSF